MIKFNPFHLVSPSPWPIFTSLSFLRFALGLIIIVRSYSCFPFIASILLLLCSSFIWSKDIHREGCYEGSHNKEVFTGFKIGMIFFIISELFFFGGMF